MGRPSLSPEAIVNNKVSIIKGVMEMIRENGISSVSARSLGAHIGMNSAMIYRYFTDIDEVILFACVHVLQDYSADMSEALRKHESPDSQLSDQELYFLSWKLFCEHAFSNPEEYRILFFSKHSSGLQTIIHDYYELFPPKNDPDDDLMLQGMFRTSDLKNRNLLLLIPVLEGRRSEQDIIMINDMTIAYFYSLLIQISESDQYISVTHQTNRMLQACRYTVEQ